MRRVLRELKRLQHFGDALEGRDPTVPPTIDLVEVSPGVWASPRRRRRDGRLLEQAAELGEIHRKVRRGFNDARDVLRKLGGL